MSERNMIALATESSNTKAPKIAYSIREAADATSMSVPYYRKKIAARELKSYRVGARVLILAEDLIAFIKRESE